MSSWHLRDRVNWREITLMFESLYERYRLQRVKRSGILDTAPNEILDRYTRIAQEVYGTDIALVSIVDKNRQWFKSKQGLSVSQTDRSLAFCHHAIKQDEVFLVNDTHEDERFRDNALVTEAPYIRFYAGVPIREISGFKIGTLCIIDAKPRAMTEQDLSILQELAALTEIEISRKYRPVRTPGAGWRQQKQMDHAIYRANQLVHSSPDEDETLDQILADIVELTGSQFGLVARLNDLDDGTSGMDVLADLAVNDLNISSEQVAMLSHLLLMRTGGEEGIQEQFSQVSGRSDVHCVALPIALYNRHAGLLILARPDEAYPESTEQDLLALLHTIGTLVERWQTRHEKDAVERRMREERFRDHFTGLPNREGFRYLFEHELQEADKRNGALTLCLLDIDALGEMNKQQGQEFGDQILLDVSRRLKEILRSGDVIARIGGDEFALLLRDSSGHDVYTRILNSVKNGLSGSEVTASMGISRYPLENVNADMMVRHAYQSMHEAKEAGKNCYREFDIGRLQHKTEKAKALDRIAQGLDGDEFDLYLQPQLKLGGGVAGFEALIRWQHPEEGVLAPNRFLPHIESTPLDRKLGQFVLKRALTLLQGWIRDGLGYSLSVNISPQHFLGGEFLQDLQSTLKELDPAVCQHLILEIVESTALDDIDLAIKNIDHCRAMGIRISLDDFGTGFSSLSYFRRLPVDEIKIDRSFVANLLTNENDQMIVDSIIALSKRFNKSIVAEGIESDAQAGWLVQMGCDIGQGYLYSRPVPVAEAMVWAEEYESSLRRDSAVVDAAIG